MPVSCITARPSPELTQAQLDLFRGLIEERVGVYFPDSRRDALRRALAARITRCGATDWDDYARLLACPKRGEVEFRRLLRHVVISETDFFRIPAHFEALRRVLLPAMVADRAREVLNIWSAACSTGEEPYSIAMTLADMGVALRGARLHLLATDVNADVIERARRGCYGERAVRRVPPEYLTRYFRRSSSGYEVSPNLRRRVAFQEFNLAHPGYPCPPPAGWDIVFCRNVVMYFRPQTTRQVLARFRQVLRSGGFLVLSPTERLTSAGDDFETIEAAGAFIYVKPPLDRSLLSLQRARAAEHIQARPRAASARSSRPSRAASRESEQEACARALADIAAERWDQAERALAPCADESWAARSHLLLAWLRALRGNCDDAAAMCLGLLAQDPLLAPAHYILGLIAARAGDLDQGLEHFGRAIYADPGLVPAHYHLGIAHHSLGDFAAARRAFRGALRALDDGRDPWLDFSEGLTPGLWRRACEERLASLAVRD